MTDFIILVLITIPWLVIVIAIVCAFIYWKHKKKELDNETTAAVIEMAAKQLVQLRMESQNTLDHALMKDEELNKLFQRNKAICEDNLIVLKKVQTENFHVRDCSIWIYDHFKKINELLEGVPVQSGIDTTQLVQMKSDAMNAMNVVVNFYQSKFNRHPEDAIREKQLITGQKKDGSKFIGESSVN